MDRARSNLDRLLADAPGDSALRHALAGAYLQLADIQGKPFTVSLGDTAGALASYRKAETLAADAGLNDWELLSILVRARRTIAQIQTRAGEYAKAMALLHATLEPARRLWQKAPRNFQVDGYPAAAAFVETNWTLGYTMLNSASNAEQSVPGFEQALAQFRRTEAMAQQIQAAYPAMPDLAAKCSQYAGYALESLGAATGDPKYFRESVVAHQRSAEGACGVRENRAGPQWQRNCADALGELSWALHYVDGEKAMRAASDSLARMQVLAEQEPSSAEAQQDLTIAYMHLGAAENTAGRFREAISHLRNAESRMPPFDQIPPNDPLGSAELYRNIDRELAVALLATHDAGGAAKVLEHALTAAQGRKTVAAWEIQDLRRRLDLALGNSHASAPVCG